MKRPIQSLLFAVHYPIALGKLCIILFLALSSSMLCAQDQVALDGLQLELKNAKKDTARISILLKISSLYYNHNYIKAASFAKQALDLSVQKSLAKFEAKSDRALANIFLNMGDYKNASSYYFKVLKLYEAEKDTANIAAMNNNLGAVYDRLQDFDKALTYYFKARDLFNHLKPEKQKKLPLPNLYNNIGNVYQSKGDVKSALQYYGKALILARESNNKYVQGIALNNLGKLHLNELKQYDDALKYLQEGLKIRQELGDKGEIARSYNILADYYRKQENFPEARQKTNQAIQLGIETGSLEVQKFAYFNLSEIEEALGDHKASLEAYKHFKSMNDSIQNQLASSEITRLQLQYDFEKAEQARESAQRQIRFRYLATIIVLIVCLTIAILITMIVRNKARQTELKRKNLSQDVEIKNKELTTNVMYLIRKNELINNVAERLLKLQRSLQPEQEKTIHEIILDLQKEGDSDSWKEFELRFHQVHGEFYQTLRKLYPNLSPTDEKLCAFLRLNMNSKEIAAITQQSIKSVEVARARLRKKLNLTNTTSNLVTHLSNL